MGRSGFPHARRQTGATERARRGGETADMRHREMHRVFWRKTTTKRASVGRKGDHLLATVFLLPKSPRRCDWSRTVHREHCLGHCDDLEVWTHYQIAEPVGYTGPTSHIAPPANRSLSPTLICMIIGNCRIFSKCTLGAHSLSWNGYGLVTL